MLREFTKTVSSGLFIRDGRHDDFRDDLRHHRGERRFRSGLHKPLAQRFPDRLRGRGSGDFLLRSHRTQPDGSIAQNDRLNYFRKKMRTFAEKIPCE